MPETGVGGVVDRELDELVCVLPAILLDGPKGVGKTATALQRAAAVRQHVDQIPAAGQFLLTGSTSGAVPAVTHTGVGRIPIVRLRALTPARTPRPLPHRLHGHLISGPINITGRTDLRLLASRQGSPRFTGG